MQGFRYYQVLIPDHPYTNKLVRLTAPQTLFGGTLRAGSIWRCFQVVTTTDGILRCNLASIDGSQRGISHCRLGHVELVEDQQDQQEGATHDDGDLFAELTAVNRREAIEEIDSLF